ncbi:MAG: hypothetical protein LBC68_08865 [Prevotellaceae bacterium]|jgi:hypothetical protein|nr:hypothetical protein [Prevotellaceae bacterium]
MSKKNKHTGMRLSKVTRQFKTNIADIVAFLHTNGYDYMEDPQEELSLDVVEFLKYNYSSYVAEKQKFYNASKSQAKPSKKTETQTTEQVPLELKIIDAASKQKKLIERIIGFTDFDWHYTVAKFEGTCSQPVDFNLFDEVLCDLLLTGQLPAKEIGDILGLDIQTDPAENEILLSAINELKRDKMIDGDESVYWLTDVGIEYAKNGVKFSTFIRQFDLYIDAVGDVKDKAKEVFSNLRSEKQISFKRDNLPQNIDDVKPLAELQAPEIHFPKKNFLLQSCEPRGVEGYVAKVWVVLLENFRDNTIRSLVYDEKQDKIIELLSDAFDKLEDEKVKLLEKLIKVGEDEDFVVEYTEEEKQKEQIAIENELIQKQEEVEIAIETQDVEKIKEIEKEVVAIKRHFNSLEFEVELKRLFDQTANDLWIISPWIKKYATFRRIPFFEKYLQKGGRIFVAYSEPENETDVMADEEAFNKLLELEKKYQNFYLNQLPPFHYKRVWLRNNGENNLYYTGSYNILSFFVKQGLQNVRQEEMTKLDWDDEKESVYFDIFTKFGVKYLNRADDDFNVLSANAPESIDQSFLQKVKSSDYGKLKPFVNQRIDIFDEKYQQLQDTKEENLQIYREQYVKSEIKNYKKEALELSKQNIALDKKRNIQGRLNTLLNEFPEFSELAELKEVAQLVSNLKMFDFGKNKPIKPNNSNNKKINKKRR